MQTKRRYKTRAHHLARHEHPNDGVPIVERTVQRILLAAVESGLEVLKVLLCRKTLSVVGVSKEHLLRKGPQLLGTFEPKDRQCANLVFYLADDDALPELAAQARRHGSLRLGDARLTGVADGWQHHRRGVVVASEEEYDDL